MEKVKDFRAKPRRDVEGAEIPDLGGAVAALFGKFPKRAVARVLSGLGRAGRDLPKAATGGMAVLPDQDEAVVGGRRDDRERSAVLYDVQRVDGPVLIAHVVAPDVEDAAGKARRGSHDVEAFGHGSQLNGNGRSRLVFPGIVQPRSSILAEVGWLVYFFAIFVAFVYAFNLWVVPHHFNDKIAVALSAGMAAIAMIATRGWMTIRARNP